MASPHANRRRRSLAGHGDGLRRDRQRAQADAQQCADHPRSAACVAARLYSASRSVRAGRRTRSVEAPQGSAGRRDRDRPDIAAGAVTYWVRSLEPIEKKSASNWSTAIAAAGTSIMIPSFGGRGCVAREASSWPVQVRPRRFELRRHGHHGQHNAQVSVRRRARESAKLRLEQSRIGATTIGSRTPRNGLPSPLIVTPSTACRRRVQVRMVTGTPLSPARDAAIGLISRVLIRRAARSVTSVPSARGQCRRESRDRSRRGPRRSRR